MPKLGTVTTFVRLKNFYESKHLQLTTLKAGNKITGFNVRYKGKNKIFLVDKQKNVLAAFIKFENFIKKLKL